MVEGEYLMDKEGNLTNPSAVIWTEKENENYQMQNWEKSENIALVKEIVAKKCNDTEFRLLMYMAKQYGLDPLKKEIWAVKAFEGQPALIFVSRDGLLTIAHKTGMFGSMETKYELEPKPATATPNAIVKPISATCTIWRKDYDKPFINTVYFDEYNAKQSIWLTKPKVMLGKVAEATCLRRAFNTNGLFIQEEFDKDGVEKANAQPRKE